MESIVFELLKSLESNLAGTGKTYFVIGALARDIHFMKQKEVKNIRKTKDVDVAVLMADEEEFYTIKKQLIESGEFVELPGKDPIKLLFRGEVELDILPFGPIENSERELVLNKPRPRFFEMNVPGYLELLPYVEESIINDISVKNCSIEGIVLLKLFANHDNPTRTHDISDIQLIIDNYFEKFTDKVYAAGYDVLEFYDHKMPNYKSLVGARVIGRKIKEVLSASPILSERVTTVLAKRPTPEWLAMLDGFND